jgi:hypothetical protein
MTSSLIEEASCEVDSIPYNKQVDKDFLVNLIGSFLSIPFIPLITIDAIIPVLSHIHPSAFV